MIHSAQFLLAIYRQIMPTGFADKTSANTVDANLPQYHTRICRKTVVIIFTECVYTYVIFG